MIAVLIASNIVIALSYLGFGFYIAPRLGVVGDPVLARVVKYMLLIFFCGCALHHLDNVSHALTEPRSQVAWMTSWHMISVDVAQAVSAPIAAFLCWRFLKVVISPVDRTARTRRDD